MTRCEEIRPDQRLQQRPHMAPFTLPERTRVEVIPNLVDVHGICSVSDTGEPPPDGPYAIYAGKLAFSKGSAKLIPVLERAGLTSPLIVVGGGPERGRIEADASRAPDSG